MLVALLSEGEIALVRSKADMSLKKTDSTVSELTLGRSTNRENHLKPIKYLYKSRNCVFRDGFYGVNTKVVYLGKKDQRVGFGVT